MYDDCIVRARETRPLAMSAELVGILSVGATLVVGGLATAGAVVGLILRLDSRSSDRMDAMEERLSARMDRTDSRLDRMDALMGRLEARMDRMDALMGRLEARMDRMDARMDTLESRQYELVQIVTRIDATQQAMLETLTLVEKRTRPTGDRPAQPPLFETSTARTDDPRESAPASAPTSA